MNRESNPISLSLELSFAYETLNKSSSRRAYDISGTSEINNACGMGDETLHSVLYQVRKIFFLSRNYICQ